MDDKILKEGFGIYYDQQEKRLKKVKSSCDRLKILFLESIKKNLKIKEMRKKFEKIQD